MKQKEFVNGLQCFKEQKIGKLQITGFVQHLCNMSDKKQTAFRLSDNLLQRLKAEAKKQNRSLNNLIEVLIDKHVPKL